MLIGPRWKDNVGLPMEREGSFSRGGRCTVGFDESRTRSSSRCVQCSEHFQSHIQTAFSIAITHIVRHYRLVHTTRDDSRYLA